jgi:hypothetical protein
MRGAPSVIYPVGRCAFHGRLLLALSALGLVTLTGWTGGASGGYFWESFGAGIGLWAVWSAWVFGAWWRTPVGALHWDSLASTFGESPRAGGWHWHTYDEEESVPLESLESVVDCRNYVLLRLKGSDRKATWIWVERHRAPARWDDLRRAMMATSRRLKAR